MARQSTVKLNMADMYVKRFTKTGAMPHLIAECIFEM